ncbi:uncharacterized protein N7482_005596 [Penicillium canariense]|uniref:Uncharacterized protein n=1 Tax=Penicillium canariense TaxID=189055 RepID=A0A9W9I2Q6_9EURO|nr:uncharacterized protein N7482_005596 [Penicillium canariense]KAJ5166815.1 hypothetical protein N7482_005596 [Penicillium canariense]
MNHTAITDRFPIIDKNIEYIDENDENAFVIPETGSIIGTKPVNFSAPFGAALSAVDFHLLSQSAKRVSARSHALILDT